MDKVKHEFEEIRKRFEEWAHMMEVVIQLLLITYIKHDAIVVVLPSLTFISSIPGTPKTNAGRPRDTWGYYTGKSCDAREIL